MSLPLSRRIARVVLLVAAGAAPVIGAAGSACAAPGLPAAPGLGGLTALDGANVGHTLDGATQNVPGIAGASGGATVAKTLPSAGKAAQKAAPAVQKMAGSTAGHAGGLVGDTAKTASDGLPADAVTKGGVPTGQLPLKGLPVG